MNMSSRRPLQAIALALSAMVLACANQGDLGLDQGLFAEMCEHMQEGPAQPFTLTATAAGAPDIALEHQRADLTLPPTTGGFSGFAAIHTTKAGHFWIGLSQDVPVIVTNPVDGSPLAQVSKTAPNPACAEVAAVLVYELPIGTFTLQVGPTAAGTLSVVSEAVGEAH